MAEKRTLSTKAKVITGIIYVLALALLVGVVYMNTHLKNDTETTTRTVSIASENENTTSKSTTELPYNVGASDKYADIEPVYPVEDVLIMRDGLDVWSAFVDGKKVEDYTGVAGNSYGWWFVRDGEVDFNYTGIAGNEQGNWYVKNGKVDFSFTGTFTVNNKTYRIVEGQVMNS